MKTEITLNGVKVEKQIPTCWDHVTYRMFLGLEKCKDDLAKRISLFTGVDEQVLKDPKTKISNLESVIAAMAFLDTQPMNVVPNNILGFPLPKDLGFESIAQFEDLKGALKDAREMSLDDHLKNYALYCAIYACTPYDWRKAEAMQELFYDAPCQEVLGIGNFTLAKLIGLRTNTDLNFQKQHTLKRRFKRALIIFQMRLAFMVQYFTWKKKPDISAENY